MSNSLISCLVRYLKRQLCNKPMYLGFLKHTPETINLLCFKFVLDRNISENGIFNIYFVVIFVHMIAIYFAFELLFILECLFLVILQYL